MIDIKELRKASRAIYIAVEKPVADDISKKLSDCTDELERLQSKEFKEKLASLCHEQWSGWMEYLFSKCHEEDNTLLTIPAWAVERWKRQMKTPYSELSEEEKESDLEEADKFLELISEFKQDN